mgnify:CR=1 FL=1
MKYSTQKRLGIIATYTGAVLVTLVCVFPFLYAISTSLKTGSELFNSDLLPKSPSFDNYVSLFALAEQNFGRHLLNSIMVATCVVVLAIFLSVTAAYALGRIQFKGRGLLLAAILSVSMFPQVAVLGGMFELIQAVGLYNRATGLIITLPFTVWVLTTFMAQLPNELEEAAIMDGCSPWQIIREVFMPLLWPALVCTGLLAFIAAWNEFLFALTFIIDDSERTVPVSISLLSGARGKIMAASVIVTLPLIALVVAFQKKIVSGLTAGAVKG